MKAFILTIIFGTIGRCYAGTFAPDTIDNWQIYNGTELVLAGNGLPPGTTPHGTIRKTQIKDLTIQFNHDAHYIGDFEITIDIADQEEKIILSKTFKSNAGPAQVIKRADLGQLDTDFITIRYCRDKLRTDQVLGKIKLI